MIKMKHYELEISQFMDNELSDDEQKILFTHLSECEECRKTLSDFMEMKKESRLFYENINVELKSAITLPFGVDSKKEKNIYKPLFYYAAAASIIFGLLFLLQQFDKSKIEKKYTTLETEYRKLDRNYNQVIKGKNDDISGKTLKENISRQHIPGNLRAVGEESGEAAAVNRITYNSAKQSSSKLVAEEAGYRRYQLRSREIQVVKVTKSDYLTPQIVGN